MQLQWHNRYFILDSYQLKKDTHNISPITDKCDRSKKKKNSLIIPSLFEAIQTVSITTILSRKNKFCLGEVMKNPLA